MKEPFSNVVLSFLFPIVGFTFSIWALRNDRKYYYENQISQLINSKSSEIQSVNILIKDINSKDYFMKTTSIMITYVQRVHIILNNKIAKKIIKQEDAFDNFYLNLDTTFRTTFKSKSYETWNSLLNETERSQINTINDFFRSSSDKFD